MTMLATMVKIIYVNSEGNGCECQLETKQKCSFLVHFNSPVIDTLLYSNKKNYNYVLLMRLENTFEFTTHL